MGSKSFNATYFNRVQNKIADLSIWEGDRQARIHPIGLELFPAFAAPLQRFFVCPEGLRPPRGRSFCVEGPFFPLEDAHFYDEGSFFPLEDAHFYDEGSFFPLEDTHFCVEGPFFPLEDTHFYDEGSFFPLKDTHFYDEGPFFPLEDAHFYDEGRRKGTDKKEFCGGVGGGKGRARIPGLSRSWSCGFIQPSFFSKNAKALLRPTV